MRTSTEPDFLILDRELEVAMQDHEEQARIDFLTDLRTRYDARRNVFGRCI